MNAAVESSGEAQAGFLTANSMLVLANCEQPSPDANNLVDRQCSAGGAALPSIARTFFYEVSDLLYLPDVCDGRAVVPLLLLCFSSGAVLESILVIAICERVDRLLCGVGNFSTGAFGISGRGEAGEGMPVYDP